MEAFGSTNHSKAETLTKKVFKGGAWILGFKIIHQLFSFIRLVILARLLAPVDFGLVGIALLVVAIFETFSQTGFGPALIQTQKKIDEYIDISWSINILRGIILFIILYASAPLTANLFKSPEAVRIVQIIGLSILLKAFVNIGVIYFLKDLEFNKQFLYDLSATLADFLVAVSAAVLLKSVWALVFGCLAGNITRLVVSYMIHPYRPRFTLDFKKARDLFHFGKWVWGSTILVFLITQGDDLFVGVVLGTAALGLYQVAYRISNLAATEIANVIALVTFPAYSKLHSNISKLKTAFLTTAHLTIFTSAPVAILIYSLSYEFTAIFLGEKWLPMIPAMQVLAIVGLLRSIAATTSPVFWAANHPDLDTKVKITQLVLLVILIYPLSTTWYLKGLSSAVLISISASTLQAILAVTRVVGCRRMDMFKLIAIPIIDATLMAISIVFVKTVMPPGTGVVGFFFLVFFGLINYFVFAYVLDKLTGARSFRMLKDILIKAFHTHS